MIFKMLALEQFAEKWPFSAGGGASDRSDPLDKARGYVATVFYFLKDTCAR